MSNRISALRKERHITQQALADFLGVSKATVVQYESSKIKTIKEEYLVVMSQLFQASPAYIMGWSNLRNDLSQGEERLIEGYRGLNTLGKHQLSLRLWELSQIRDYTNAIVVDEEEYLKPVAAHADGASDNILQEEIKRISKLIGEFKE